MQVDYYVLSEQSTAARETFCCRLVEKAYDRGYRVFVLTADAESADALDARLWPFRHGASVRHATLAEAHAEPLLLGDRPPAEPLDLLVNLGTELPPRWQEWNRVAEIVVQMPDVLSATRDRFRQYREAGMEPTVHR